MYPRDSDDNACPDNDEDQVGAARDVRLDEDSSKPLSTRVERKPHYDVGRRSRGVQPAAGGAVGTSLVFT